MIIYRHVIFGEIDTCRDAMYVRERDYFVMISFNLPKELIAQEPTHPRDAARLLVYDRTSKTIEDRIFHELPDLLAPHTTLVLNNAKVDRCRWMFHNDKTELFVLEKLDQHTVRAMVRPGRKFKSGSTVHLTDWLTANVTAVDNDGVRTLWLNVQHDDPRLTQFEHVPLPPYMQQNDDLADEYQTIYASSHGSKAAPTAGLHFTKQTLQTIAQSHDILEVTLHVGLGTFAPLKDENFKLGTLHKERYEIDINTAQKLESARHITAVGTTTVRTLEAWRQSGKLNDTTDMFIQPGYQFKAINSMITNFHLPGTSLLLMVEAFLGSEIELQRIYDYAIKQRYRFYSFGDAMLVI